MTLLKHREEILDALVKRPCVVRVPRARASGPSLRVINGSGLAHAVLRVSMQGRSVFYLRPVWIRGSVGFASGCLSKLYNELNGPRAVASHAFSFHQVPEPRTVGFPFPHARGAPGRAHSVFVFFICFYSFYLL